MDGPCCTTLSSRYKMSLQIGPVSRCQRQRIVNVGSRSLLVWPWGGGESAGGHRHNQRVLICEFVTNPPWTLLFHRGHVSAAGLIQFRSVSVCPFKHSSDGIILGVGRRRFQVGPQQAARPPPGSTRALPMLQCRILNHGVRHMNDMAKATMMEAGGVACLH